MKSHFGYEMVVEEYDHALLVRGTDRVHEAQEALVAEGWASDLSVARQYPARPMFYEGGPCVAMYFEVTEFS